MTDLVTVDLGGTHARFALAEVANDGAIALDEPETLRASEHASFETAWDAFRASRGGSLPRAVAMSVAGPVGGAVIRFTNNPWVIRPDRLDAELGTQRHTIINDFAAVAHAVARSPADRFDRLCGPEGPLPATGTLTVLGPGTGLGVAQLWRGGSGNDYRVQPTEGGHVDFAPVDAIDDAILARLRARHTRVSAERVVSGPGIVDIHAALAGLEGRAVSAEVDPVELWTAGTVASPEGDPLARAAVERFCMALGSVAGDFALAHGAVGVVVSGGLGYRYRDTIRASAFAERFGAKGRFAALMAGLPVRLFTDSQPGLLGAAAAFAKEHLR